jgi:hypothetical protein
MKYDPYTKNSIKMWQNILSKLFFLEKLMNFVLKNQGICDKIFPFNLFSPPLASIQKFATKIPLYIILKLILE